VKIRDGIAGRARRRAKFSLYRSCSAFLNRTSFDSSTAPRFPVRPATNPARRSDLPSQPVKQEFSGGTASSGAVPPPRGEKAAPDLEAAYGMQVWKRGSAFGQASNIDQTKSRRIQSFDGSGSGNPTGRELGFSKVMPSVPSLLTEDKS
jgi:hypothetical protein